MSFFDRDQQLADFARRDPSDPALRFEAARTSLTEKLAALPAVDHNGNPLDRDSAPSSATWVRDAAEQKNTDAVAQRAIETLTPQLGAEMAAQVVADARAAGGAETIQQAMADVAEHIATLNG